MRLCFILLFTLFSTVSIYADTDLFPIKKDHLTKFESLTEKDGLAGNKVFDIIQDTIGFMWFATDNGLCRYDGYGFVIYNNTAGDSSTISNNLITCLEIDYKGNLWVGTEHGLNLFNRNTESFTSFYKSVKNKYSLNDNHIKALYADTHGILWIETAGGVLHKFVIETGEIQKYRHEKPHQPYYRYHEIYEDFDNNLWIGGRNIPVTIFNRETEKFIYNYADPTNPDKKRDNDVACYYEDLNYNFWVSATDGVYLMDKETLKFKKVLRSSTFSIIQDINGTIWMGSGNGLIRKEKGENLVVNYQKNQDNPFSIVDNHIHKLYEDRSGVIWIGTANGISKYCPRKYKFGNYRHIGNVPNTLSGNRITAITEDKSAHIWIATQSNGLNKLNPVTGDITHFKSTVNIKKGLSSNRISSLYIDKKENIWVGLWAGVGFNKLDPVKNTFTHYAYDPYSLKRDWYNDFLETKDGRFFCGIWGATGFSEFDRQKGQFTGMNYINESRPQNKSVKAIQFCAGKIFFGSNSARLYSFNIKTEHFISYHRRSANPSVPDIKLPFGDQKNIIDVHFTDINDLFSYQDKFLLCASDKGLLIQDLKSNSFRSLTKKKYPLLLSDELNSFYKISKDTLCIIGSQGLNFFDLSKEKLVSFSIALPEPPVTVLRSKEFLFLVYSNFIQKLNLKSKKLIDEYHLNEQYSEVKFSCALEFTPKKIILGTNRGSCVFDIENGVIIEFFDKSFSNTENWFSVNTLFKDREDNIWLGTDIGFGKMDLDHSSIQWVRDSLGEVDRLIKGNVQCITEDEDGKLWLGTESGACIYDKNTHQLIHLKSKGKYGLSSHLINKLFEDINGNIWVATSDQGLNVILKNGDIKHYPGDIYDPSGFRSEDVISIFQDSKKNIWVGGDKGLNKFEGLNKPIKNFTTENGLAHHSIMAILEDDNEQLWISTGNGISRFDLKTDQVIRNYNKLDGIQDNSFNRANCKLKNGILMFGGNEGISLIDPAKMNEKELIPDIAFTALNNNNELISTEISSGNTIIILPKTKFFSIEFSALEYSEAKKNKYKYKLSGSYNDWINLGNEHKISFTNLAPGKYKLFVTASNNDGLWNEKGIYLVLIIKPPFWKTWWFISLIALLIIATTSSLLVLKINNLKKEKMSLQLEQRLLRTQMNPHFIFNVLAAVQGLIYKKDTKIVINYLSKFAALMRSILYHSREEFILLENEILFIENYLKLQQLRFSDNFEYNITIDPLLNPSIVSIPPMLLQPFIENAIEHGFRKKTETKGKIKIKFMKTESELRISIEDNGIGIENAKKDNASNDKNHESLGIKTTLERIVKMNNVKNKDSVFEIIDLGMKNPNKSGTRIYFKIPFTELY